MGEDHDAGCACSYAQFLRERDRLNALANAVISGGGDMSDARLRAAYARVERMGWSATLLVMGKERL